MALLSRKPGNYCEKDEYQKSDRTCAIYWPQDDSVEMAADKNVRKDHTTSLLMFLECGSRAVDKQALISNRD